MPRRNKLILAVVVVVVGTLLAWQFRKAGEPATTGAELTAPFAATKGATDAAVPKAVGPAPQADAAATAPAARLVGAAGLPAAQPDLVAQPKKSVDAKPLGERSLPEMSASFPAADGNRPTPVGAAGVSRPLERGIGFDETASGRTHKLIDGDTLPELAKEYLGSADRWRELYDFNRDVLADPELLPIGAELRIPTAPYRPQPQDAPTAAQPAGAAAAPGPAKSPAQPVSQPLGSAPTAPPRVQSAEPVNGAAAAGQLAPVESGSAKSIANADAGKKDPVKLQHLPPVAPVGHVLRVAPRTYVVQPGETLNSIAEKLYGDGARENLLREANRSLVSNPQELRPGTVLVVPLAGQ